MTTPSTETTEIHVVGLCGSLREGGYTRQALKVALRGAEGPGVTTVILDLDPYDLPFCRGKDNQTTYGENVRRFRSAIRAADAIIIATPEYHGSFSGVVKNALDLAGFEEFEGKMIGLVGVSGGRYGASDALNTLRAIGRSLHAWVVPSQATIPSAWESFDENGEPRSQQDLHRLLAVGREVARFARLHKCGEHMQFLKEWETAPVNPGGHAELAAPPRT